MSISSTKAFEGVIDQDAAIAQLENAATNQDAMVNTWLITGAPGSGRENIAYGFAKLLLGEDVDLKNCADVQIVKTSALTIKVDQVRDLIETSSIYPAQYKYRIFIIEDADRMTPTAQNALLKAIEEPASFAVWIFLAPSSAALLPTIRSRSRIIHLKTVSTASIEQLLTSSGVESERASIAARLSGGHVGVAKNLATSDIALDDRKRVAELALSIQHVSDAIYAASEIVDLATKSFTNDIEARFNAQEEALRASLNISATDPIPKSESKAFRELKEDKDLSLKRALRDYVDIALQEIMMVYRDIASVQMGVDSGRIINVFDKERIATYASSQTLADTISRVEVVLDARKKIAANCLVPLTLEAMFASLLIPDRVLQSLGSGASAHSEKI
jgi:DNA polymerase-3 subunit delta'